MEGEIGFRKGKDGGRGRGGTMGKGGRNSMKRGERGRETSLARCRGEGRERRF